MEGEDQKRLLVTTASWPPLGTEQKAHLIRPVSCHEAAWYSWLNDIIAYKPNGSGDLQKHTLGWTCASLISLRAWCQSSWHDLTFETAEVFFWGLNCVFREFRYVALPLAPQNMTVLGDKCPPKRMAQSKEPVGTYRAYGDIHCLPAKAS